MTEELIAIPSSRDYRVVMTTIERGGRTVGFGVEGNGPPLLAFHGTTQARGAWDQVRASCAVERTWVTVEFPGSGESSMPDAPMELSDIVSDALAVMDHLGHAEFDVVGYSLGAVAALELAATSPERVRTVTSLCGWAASDARMRMTFDLWRRLIAQGPELFMRYALVDGYTATGLEGLEPFADAAVGLAATMVQPGSDAHLELDTRIDIRESLPKVSSPCLVLGAAEDRWVDISKSHEIVTLVPGATLVVLPAGHLVINELADVVASHLAHHLDFGTA